MLGRTAFRNPSVATRTLVGPILAVPALSLGILLVLKDKGLVAVGLTVGLLLVFLLDLDLVLTAITGTALFAALVPNTVYEYLTRPEEFQSLWTMKLFRGVLVVDLMFAALGARFILDLALKRIKSARLLFDKPLIYLAGLVAFGALIGATDRGDIQIWSSWFWSIRIFLYLFFFYYVCSRTLSSFRHVNRFVGIILAVIVARWLYTMADSLFYNPTGFMSASGLEALFFNETAGLIIPVAVMSFIFLTRGGMSRWRYVMFGLLFGAILVSLIISGRRGAVLMIILGAAVYPLTAKSKLGLRRVFATGLLLALAFSVFLATNRAAQDVMVSVAESVRNPEEGTGERIAEIRNVVENLDRYGGTVYGLGLGRWWRVFYPHWQFSSYTAFSDVTGRGTKWLASFHTSWLDILLYFGWGGLIIYFYLWFRMGKAMRDRISMFPPGEARTLGQALFCALVSLFPGMTLQPHLIIIMGALLGASAALLGHEDVRAVTVRSSDSAVHVRSHPPGANTELISAGRILPRLSARARSVSGGMRGKG